MSRSTPAVPVTPEARVALPELALDPPAADCYADTSWRVCMLGDTDGQKISAWFGQAPSPSASTGVSTTPAALLITAGGAGLGLYAPRSSMERLTRPPVVSAWAVREGTGVTSWIALRYVASIGAYDVPAGSVYRPPPDGFDSTDRWPKGRYIVRLQAATGGWERWFAMEITSTVPDSGGSDRE